ncbi:hypothetical protein ACPXB3_00350 [Gordonia sp. DT219]|uniref:hypothetical protein n=1 Tax=Gordonia sp. DT219 TaxID=3416658 RepID=UPI003CEAC07F
MHVTEQQAAQYVGRSVRQLRKWRNDFGMRYSMQPTVGVIYDTDDLDEMRDRMAARVSPGRPLGSRNRPKGNGQ